MKAPPACYVAAAARSLKPLFDPASIAIIGASNDSNKFGGRPIRFMKEGGYRGRIYPINPKEKVIQGLAAYPDIRQAPEPVDLVIVSLPAPLVLEQIKACADARARAVCIFSSGFAEVGGAGAAWQAELTRIAKASGTRLVGPNCMGMLNTASRAVGTFSSAFEHGWPKPGNVIVVSQSGAVGSHSLVLLRERGLGLRGWVTTGNECDVDVADCIAFAAEDPETRVVVAYMEGCQDAGRFLAAVSAARKNRKPVLIMKVGASEVGASAASTHTASLAGADEVFDAAFRQFGVHRVRTLEEMTDIASACSAGVYPTGNRLGIVTISGGVGVLSCDTAAAHGLDVPPLPAATQAELKALMPFATVRNPVDTTAQLLTDHSLLQPMVKAILDNGGCDAVMVFMSSLGFAPRIMGPFKDTMARLREAYPDRLIALSIMSGKADREQLESLKFLVFDDPSRAVAAIAALVRFGRAFARPADRPPPTLPAAARAPASGTALSEHAAARLLADAGIPTVATEVVASADAAVAAAERLGYPVALKVASADIAHKSDVGGVKLGLGDAEAVRHAHAAILASVAGKAPGARVDGVLVAPMVQDGVECILGVHRDPVFGPVVLCGLGGIFVEILKDVSLRIAPFGTDEARRMLDELRGRRLLDGARGRPPADVEALVEALARLSVYADRHRDRIESIDINPFAVLPRGHGAMALDAVVVPMPRQPPG
ncbi:MAG: acetate--CoA ligase family protein [Alphaproteobacteria bacterium]|nr:acetate--CoA ligase family protein [Alphaproteobacteria bacterium]